jgi:hypothetical protein
MLSFIKKGKGVAKIHELDPKPSKDAIWEIENSKSKYSFCSTFYNGKRTFSIIAQF